MKTINKSLITISTFGIIFNFLSLLLVASMTYKYKDMIVNKIKKKEGNSISKTITISSTFYQLFIPFFVVPSGVMQICSELLHFIIGDKTIIDRIYITLSSISSMSQIYIMTITLMENRIFHTIFAVTYFFTLVVILLLNTILYVYRRLMNPNFKLIRILIVFFKVLLLLITLMVSYIYLQYYSSYGFYVFELIITTLATIFFAINSLELYDMDNYVVTAIPQN